MADLGRVENLFLPSPAGRLEVLWKHQLQPTNRFAVLCHPHPMHGGTMHNKVVFQAATAFFLGRFHVVRFNFRGVGRSTGSFAHGEGEQDDLRSVLAAVKRREPHAGIVLCGYSFGAYVSARVALAEAVPGLVLIAPPARHYSFEFLRNMKAAVAVVFAERDELVEVQEQHEVVRWLGCPRMVITVEADHSFESRLDDLQHLLAQTVVPFVRFFT